jgi:hypothetical protein
VLDVLISLWVVTTSELLLFNGEILWLLRDVQVNLLGVRQRHHMVLFPGTNSSGIMQPKVMWSEW